jgi:GNAT superfamily N-acetyltransferase
MKDAAELAIRVPVLADAESIARVHVDTWRETYAGLMPDRYFDEDALAARRRMWTQVLSADPRRLRVAVAEVRGEIVGFASAELDPSFDADHGHPPARSMHLYTLYLLAALHGSGAGQVLLDAVIGDEPAELWVARENPRARAFYARNGFAADGVEFVDTEVRDLVELRMVR